MTETTTTNHAPIINQARISEQVYDYLRGAIMTGRYAPGERLNLEELVAQLQVSKMPVKEAVARLANEGLIEVQARRGTYVSRVDARELAEAFEVRRALEVLAGELAAARVTVADIAKLNALITAMEKGAAKRDVREHSEQNFAFHELIVSLSGNRKLAEIYRQLRAGIHIAGVHYRSEHWLQRVAQEQREHRAIVRALERRDAEAVARAITGHLKRGRASLLEDVARAEKQSR
jgi:GntR family transcriptional regulator, rspAB operon transcriptional repressor